MLYVDAYKVKYIFVCHLLVIWFLLVLFGAQIINCPNISLALFGAQKNNINNKNNNNPARNITIN